MSYVPKSTSPLTRQRCNRRDRGTGGDVPGAWSRGVRKLLQRTGIVDESVTALSTDPAAVGQLLGAPWYEERLR